MANYRTGASAKLHERNDDEVQKIKSGLTTQEPRDAGSQPSLQTALDKAFPNVKHRQIVEYQGKRYRCRYFPEQMARSGWAVSKWGKRWEPIEG